MLESRAQCITQRPGVADLHQSECAEVNTALPHLLFVADKQECKRQNLSKAEKHLAKMQLPPREQKLRQHASCLRDPTLDNVSVVQKTKWKPEACRAAGQHVLASWWKLTPDCSNLRRHTAATWTVQSPEPWFEGIDKPQVLLKYSLRGTTRQD